MGILVQREPSPRRSLVLQCSQTRSAPLALLLPESRIRHIPTNSRLKLQGRLAATYNSSKNQPGLLGLE